MAQGVTLAQGTKMSQGPQFHMLPLCLSCLYLQPLSSQTFVLGFMMAKGEQQLLNTSPAPGPKPSKTLPGLCPAQPASFFHQLALIAEGGTVPSTNPSLCRRAQPAAVWVGSTQKFRSREEKNSHNLSISKSAFLSETCHQSSLKVSLACEMHWPPQILSDINTHFSI